MGKLMTYVTILIFIDILFLVTAQFVIASPSSVIINSINDLSTLTSSNFWQILISTTGISTLAITAVVIAGLITRASDILIFVPMAVGLALLIGDYIAIFSYIASINKVFALLTFVPIVVMFSLVIVEWLRGKD